MKTIDNGIRRTKIIATIGPASEKVPTLSKLILAGADIFRFNLKHNTILWHSKIIDEIRRIAKKQTRSIQIMIDIPNSSFQAGIELVVEKKADYIALSNITGSEEVSIIRRIIKKEKLKTNIVAKIETKEALINFSSILKETDIIMVARGDLGRAITIEKVPFAQKELIVACNKVNKLVIVATEMFLSMVSKKEPTRAEVSDVANAVLEGSDIVMLSEETAIGNNSVEAVKIMSRVIREAERWQKLGHLEICVTKNKKIKFGL